MKRTWSGRTPKPPERYAEKRKKKKKDNENKKASSVSPPGSTTTKSDAISIKQPTTTKTTIGIISIILKWEKFKLNLLFALTTYLQLFFLNDMHCNFDIKKIDLQSFSRVN